MDIIHALLSGWITLHSEASIVIFLVNRMHSLYLVLIAFIQLIAATL